jgi:glycosyltransferase involved in cell wall biosynthesis
VPGSTIIAFVTFEAPYFRCGGLAAVMDRLPPAVSAAAGVPTVAIAPFHISTAPGNKIPSLPLEQAGLISVQYEAGALPVTLLRYSTLSPRPSPPGCGGGRGRRPAAGEAIWYFLRVDDAGPANEPPFFAGERHPFDLPNATLVRDAFLFGAAVVRSLPAIARDLDVETAEWRLVLQDWEAATAGLAFVSHSGLQGRLFLTLHNSYDAYAPPADQLMAGGRLWPGLQRVGIDSQSCPGHTVLERTFGVVEWPIFTVSDRFASEFTEDLLQRHIMVPHLQAALRQRPILGVDNGPFKDLVIPEELLRPAASGDPAGLASWKAREKAKARDALGRPLPDTGTGWGNATAFLSDDGPWLVMAGRDDPRQKGYDLAAAAVGHYLEGRHEAPDCAQFLFFPITGDEGVEGLRFLEALAGRFPRRVLVFIGRWDDGFAAALRGSTYGLMPSLYEPFGMANEFYLDGGCVGIARATGGNVQQIVPLRSAASCSHAVRVRGDRYHSLSAHPTGLLFRERDDIETAASDWAAINDAGYNTSDAMVGRLEARRDYPLFQAMAKELAVAIEDGIRLYTEQPNLYYRMLATGVDYIQQTFSWNRAAQEYLRYLL